MVSAQDLYDRRNLEPRTSIRIEGKKGSGTARGIVRLNAKQRITPWKCVCEDTMGIRPLQTPTVMGPAYFRHKADRAKCGSLRYGETLLDDFPVLSVVAQILDHRIHPLMRR